MSSASSDVFTLDSGPFQGLELPFQSAGANAAHVTRDLIDTYLITHPHLDHISAFVVNTASLHSARPKRIAGLPSTITAFKQHIFNNVIWPNLSDEDNGAGLVTYMRLNEGGSLALGAGDSQGYIEITEGLGVKTWSVSHGHCMEHHSGSISEFRTHSNDRASQIVQSIQYESSPSRSGHPPPSHIFTRRYPPERIEADQRMCIYDSSAYFIRDIETSREVVIFGDVEPDSISLSPRNLQIWTEAAPKVATGLMKGILIECSYTDSRPDSVLFGHLCPRHLIAELKILASLVEGVWVEMQKSSESGIGKKRKRHNNGVPNGPEPGSTRRRSNRTSNTSTAHVGAPIRPGIVRMGSSNISPRTRPRLARSTMSNDSFDELDSVDLGSPRRSHASDISTDSRYAISTLPEALNELGDSHIHPDMPQQKPGQLEVDQGSKQVEDHIPYIPTRKPLSGLKVVIIHVKEMLEDEIPPGDTILHELLQHEAEAQLGCEFVISEPGMSIYV